MRSDKSFKGMIVIGDCGSGKTQTLHYSAKLLSSYVNDCLVEYCNFKQESLEDYVKYLNSIIQNTIKSKRNAIFCLDEPIILKNRLETEYYELMRVIKNTLSEQNNIKWIIAVQTTDSFDQDIMKIINTKVCLKTSVNISTKILGSDIASKITKPGVSYLKNDNLDKPIRLSFSI